MWVCKWKIFVSASFAAVILLGCTADVGTVASQSAPAPVAQTSASTCDVEFMILGVGQDAGAPQIGNRDDPAWADPSKRMLATSAALIDHRSGERYLFEATPDVREQLQMLDEYAPPTKGPLGLSGVFLTHAHIGHYAGLMFFGRESAGTDALTVYVMPRMKNYLENNGPWEQLIALENIRVQSMENMVIFAIGGGSFVSRVPVAHRDEYSETVGFVISTRTKQVLFLPDIDSWDEVAETLDNHLGRVLKDVDYAFVDATFYDDNELPGRDMSKIPHPRVTETMDLFDSFGAEFQAKTHFIHINHTNPIRDPDSAESQKVQERGYKIARRGEIVCLSD